MARRVVKRRNKRQIPVGDMREEIKIQSFEQKAGGFSDPSFCEQFVDKYEVWASLETIETIGGGEERFSKVNLREGETHRFTIRFIGDISGEQRVLWDNNYYQVKRIIDPNERKEYSMIFCHLFGDRTTKANT